MSAWSSIHSPVARKPHIAMLASEDRRLILNRDRTAHHPLKLLQQSETIPTDIAQRGKVGAVEKVGANLFKMNGPLPAQRQESWDAGEHIRG